MRDCSRKLKKKKRLICLTWHNNPFNITLHAYFTFISHLGIQLLLNVGNIFSTFTLKWNVSTMTDDWWVIPVIIHVYNISYFYNEHCKSLLKTFDPPLCYILLKTASCIHVKYSEQSNNYDVLCIKFNLKHALIMNSKGNVLIIFVTVYFYEGLQIIALKITLKHLKVPKYVI